MTTSQKLKSKIETVYALIVQGLAERALRSELNGKADAAKCKYEFNTATVDDSNPNNTRVSNVLDHAKNSVTLGPTVTAAHVLLPSPSGGYTRDLFISLTIENTTSPVVYFTDPVPDDDPDIIFGSAQLADIDTGRNLILFSEVESGKWKVAVEHEDSPEVTP